MLLAGVGVMVTLLGTRRRLAGDRLRLSDPPHPDLGRYPCCRWRKYPPTSLRLPTWTCCTPSAPIQTAIRALLGYDSPRQFRLPDLRSIYGTIFVLGFVLYPYVYLSTRVMFMTQA